MGSVLQAKNVRMSHLLCDELLAKKDVSQFIRFIFINYDLHCQILKIDRNQFCGVFVSCSWLLDA